MNTRKLIKLKILISQYWSTAIAKDRNTDLFQFFFLSWEIIPFSQTSPSPKLITTDLQMRLGDFCLSQISIHSFKISHSIISSDHFLCSISQSIVVNLFNCFFFHCSIICVLFIKIQFAFVNKKLDGFCETIWWTYGRLHCGFLHV